MNRGALSLLSNYGGDSSDEEVPNGRVSVKRCASEEDLSNKRLPVPDIICRNSVNKDVPIDDPSLHNGHIRSFPHERGNWVTYVYIPYEPNDLCIDELIAHIINSLSQFSFHTMNNFHISLTRTVILKHHWIELFIKSVREKLSSFRKFVVIFDSLKVYCNEERTRTFLAIRIRSGYDTLIRLVENLDNCLAEFQLPPFYKDPSFHMSIASCVGDFEKEVAEMLPNLNATIQKICINQSQNNWYNYVTHIECKCGNKLFTFNMN
ncbi:hypothetical protein RI129_008871 [Pyrocoelia pectoralis]|uniref:U6 snRNA phosphodiesterase n=1 Tax=Pyrocoelia pectoralis TaxID=417401 RepID=A0AAN7VEY2_9COLE